MTKEQFWRIIEDVNAVSQNHDQETVWTRIVENLSHYPLEDIMDWHLIYHEYKDAAYRDEMFAVSTALGSDYADEGLNNFRAWLISCGKEVFMNALREPVATVYKGNIIKINNGLPILRRDTAQTRLRAVFL